MRCNPTIITGMHRSGTTLLCKLLEKSGLFMGNQKDGNNESLFFLHLEEWILKNARARWDAPHNYSLMDMATKEKIAASISKKLSGPSREEFLGPELAKKYKDLRELDIPWGWKQPRATITADIWHKIFPDAKVLHIMRNPVDVAQSLKKRQETVYKRRYRRAAKRILTLGLTSKTYSSSKLLDINNGVSLWEDYMKRALLLDSIFRSNVMHVRYEDLLENPEKMFSDIFSFAELTTKGNLSDIIGQIDQSRKYAFMENRELKEVYNRIVNREMVRRFKYDKI